MKLFEAAKLGNSMICLPTGSGKTYIAIMLIKHYQNELIDDFEHREAKRTFFLVPTKPLVDQQAKQIQTWTSLRVGQFTGQTEIEEKGKVIGIDFWSKEMWKEKFKKYHVLVMTPQILLRLLTHRQIHLSKINLIVFDEAHWAGPKRNLAKSNHDYTQIVDYIRNQVNEHQPRILGLSASLIKNKVNPERIRQYVKVFEQSFNAKCLTVYGIEDLGDKSTNPREILWCFASDSIIACSLVNNILSKVFEFLDSLIQEYESQNHIQYADTDSNKEELNIRITTKLPLGPSKLKLCLVHIYEILIEMGPWCGENAIKYFSIYFEYILYLYGHILPPYKEILVSFLRILETCRSILKEFMSEMTEQQKIIDFVSPKMKRLLELLLNFKNNDEKLDKQICGLVFVQRRAECKTLTSWLTELKKYDPDNFGFMEVGYAVGISNQPGFLKSLVSSTQKTQTRTLEEFRSGKKNLLIATSVLEEGLDVGGCNLVVRYDFPHTLRDYLQSKGRARNNDSHYVLFCPEKERYFRLNEINTFHAIENELQHICKERCFWEESDTIDQFEGTEDEKDIVSRSGARITLESSISIVRMYCDKLPSDSSTKLAPLEQCEASDGQFRYVIRLPINATRKVSLIEGPWKRSKNLAKKVAYLQICRILYDTGELNESLIPKKRIIALEKIISELNLPLASENKEFPKRGTRKRRDQYSKFIFFNLNWNHKINIEKNLFLYVIDIEQYSEPHDKRKIGLLSSNSIALENICISSFPIFQNNQQNNVKIKLLKDDVYLDFEYLDSIIKMNNFIIQSLSPKDETPLKFCETSSLYIVFLMNDLIDWQFINTLNQSLNANSVNMKELSANSKFEFKKAKYENGIVSPLYRKSAPFYVVKIESFLNPKSEFPNPKNYKDYEDYYKRRWNVEITNKSQPLLLVENLNIHFANITDVEGKKKKFKKHQPMHLIPELCALLPFSYSLYAQIRCLPAILFRLNQLLAASQFKLKLESEIFSSDSQIIASMAFTFHCDRFYIDIANSKDETTFKKELLEMKSKLNIHDDKEDDFEDPEEFDRFTPENEEIEETNDDDIRKFFVESSDEEDDEDFEGSEKTAEDDDDYEGPEKTKLKKSMKRQVDDSTSDKNSSEKKREQDDKKRDVKVYLSEERNLEVNPFKISKIGHSHDSNFVHDELFLQKGHFKDFDLNKFVSEVTDNIKYNFRKLFEPSNLMEVEQGVKILSDPELCQMAQRINCFERIKSFDNGNACPPNANLILQALTSKRCIDGFNLERLETIGDSFLKFTTSLFLFYKYPDLNVGDLVILKDKQVQNYNLWKKALEKNIPEFIMFEQFSASKWFSTVFTSNEEYIQEIDDKSIADCIEALIGAYLISYGPVGAIMFMKWLGLNVTPQNYINLNSIHWLPKKNLSSKYNFDENEKLNSLYVNGRLFDFEESIGYSFKDKSHIVKAFTHSSYYDNTITGCYQRLEFLGDAVLDYLITRYIFEDKKEFNPGELTDLRQALVNNSYFGCLAVKYCFHKYLKYLSCTGMGIIDAFDKKFKSNEKEIIYGHFLLINENETEQSEDVEVPKILGDIFESVAGAIYLDSGFSLDAVWKVYYPLIKSELEYFSENVPLHPIRMLYEADEKTKFEKAIVLDSKRVIVNLWFRGELYEGEGRNTKFAKIVAAKKAVKTIAKVAV